MLKKSEAKEKLILIALSQHAALPISTLAYIVCMPMRETRRFIEKLLWKGYLFLEYCGGHIYYSARSDLLEILDAADIAEMRLLLRSPPQLKNNASIRAARTCYGHLAGILGVTLTQRLIEIGWLEKMSRCFQMTKRGVERLADHGLLLKNLKSKSCLDGTEREYHLGGELGKALTDHYFQMGWLEHVPYSRAVRVTEIGEKNFQSEFGIQINMLCDVETGGSYLYERTRDDLT